MSQDPAPTTTDARPEPWLASLDTYGVQWLAVDKRRDGALLDLVRSRPGWSIDFEDEESALLACERPSNGTLAAISYQAQPSDGIVEDRDGSNHPDRR